MKTDTSLAAKVYLLMERKVKEDCKSVIYYSHPIVFMCEYLHNVYGHKQRWIYLKDNQVYSVSRYVLYVCITSQYCIVKCSCNSQNSIAKWSCYKVPPMIVPTHHINSLEVLICSQQIIVDSGHCMM